MPKTLTPVVPYFDSVEAFQRDLKIKRHFGPVDLYPRDGCVLLAEVEDRLAGLAEVGGRVVSYNSGMSAVFSAIDIVLDHATSTRPVLAFSHGLYKQTRKYIEQHASKRATMHVFDSGSIKDVRRVFDELRPDVIVTESVSNHIDSPVLDVGHLLDLTRSARKTPALVIDNTLPLSTGLALAKLIRNDDHVIIVESCTKAYTFNQELLGLAYTKHAGLEKALLDYRRTIGTIPNGASLKRIAELLPASKTEFDRRNQRLFAHTEALALSLEKAGLPPSHPALPMHHNHELYQRDFPVGGTQVFYIKSSLDYRELAARLWKHPGVRRNARLGQSFGFDETRILIDENARAIRLAGGSETNVDELAPALVEAIKVS